MPIDDYKVELEVFEGPLDLLLYLIKRDEVDIYDIPIERITSQQLVHQDLRPFPGPTVIDDYSIIWLR